MLRLLRLITALALAAAVRPLAAAQAPSLLGEITGTDARPLASVRVMLVELQRFAISDSLGRFVLTALPSGSYTVSFQRLGLLPETRAVELRDGVPVRLTLRMRASRIELAAVQISAGVVATTTHRATQPTAVLGAEALRRSQGASVGETLADMPGLRSMSLTTGIGKPVIRGLHSTRVVTMSDGNRVDGQQWGTDHGPNVETATAERVEVIKGPASVLYGAEAMGGVINIIPRALPWSDGAASSGVTRQLSASYNSNLRAPDVTVSVAAAHGKMAWRAVGTGRVAQDMRTATSALSNTGSKTGFGELTLGVRPSWGEVRVVASAREERIEIYDDPVDDPGFTGFQRLSTQRGTLLVERSGQRGRIDLRFSGEQNFRREFESDGATIPALGLLARSWNGRGTFTHAPWMGGWRGTVGAALSHGTFDKRGIETLIPSNATRGLGIFVYEQREQGRLNVSMGARADWQSLRANDDAVLKLRAQSRAFRAITGTAGAAWQLSGPLAIAANVGRGFRAPAAQELFANGFHEGSRAYERGDSTVRVETSLNTDVALRLQATRVRGEITVYRNAIRDYLYLRPFGSGGLLFDSLQVVQGNALLQGAEASGEWRPAAHLALTASVDFVQGTNTTTRTPLLYMPPLRGSTGIRVDGQRLPRVPLLGAAARSVQRPYLSMQVEANRRQTRIEARDFAPPGSLLLHGALGGVVSAAGRVMTVDITARNIGNVRYRDYMSRYKEFADALGRSVVLRVSAGF